ncbi:MAG: hypothetical protein JOY62_14675 [Acidobacteriaceae bacterium]|nr:hypothetical protein [Acidobacteriaceae bacterium]MBV9781205.1 hypothetical protein [Acidobacteriaceae bacterium]
MRHTDAGWSNPKVLAIIALVFLCGAAVGSAVTRQYLHSRLFPAEHVRLDRLKAELNLTPEQEKVVTKELDDYAKYYQNIEEQREDVADLGRARIRQVLNEEQKKRFDELFKNWPH